MKNNEQSENCANAAPAFMLGAICGDIAGSIYEHHNIKIKPDKNLLIDKKCCFTDDTVMTCAVADGLRRGLKQLPENWLEIPEAYKYLYNEVQDALRAYGRKYPYAGYGGSFRRWLHSPAPEPYGSWGNGSAMRASYAGWAAGSLEEAKALAEISASVTHNHEEGIKGAIAVAVSIWILRNGGTKEDVEEYAKTLYPMNFTLDQIRPGYIFDVSCQGSVPQAIRAFLEGEDFADVIAGAISIGGDSDTIAAIAGSIAEVIYPIPQELRDRAMEKLDSFLLNTIIMSVDFLNNDNYRRLDFLRNTCNQPISFRRKSKHEKTD